MPREKVYPSLVSCLPSPVSRLLSSVFCLLSPVSLRCYYSQMDLNYYVLLVFAPLLIVVGILGFIIPENKSLTSGAPAYNIFHIVFGIIGLSCVLFGVEPCIRAFNIGFGAIDLYQAVASFANLPPKAQFRWKRADDVLHVVIGAALVIVGIFGS